MRPKTRAVTKAIEKRQRTMTPRDRRAAARADKQARRNENTEVHPQAMIDDQLTNLLEIYISDDDVGTHRRQVSGVLQTIANIVKNHPSFTWEQTEDKVGRP